MVVIVNLGTANVGSIVNMLRRVGVESEVSRDPEVIRRADRLILPGVGGFDSNAGILDEPGIRESLEAAVVKRSVPCFGICLGMQLMCESSEEGTLSGLGWFPARVVRFPKVASDGKALRVPHMGWNRIRMLRDHAAFADVPADARFYFVHSYFMQLAESSLAIGVCEYGLEFVCAAGLGNVLAVQFHPEKSHRYGMGLMSGFARWAP